VEKNKNKTKNKNPQKHPKYTNTNINNNKYLGTWSRGIVLRNQVIFG